MRVEQGGTKLWCPYCRAITVCKAVNPSQLTGKSGQRWHKTDHKDINWFRRCRVCQECDTEFLTAEVPETFLEELVELRDALRDLKAHAGAYLKQSANAGRSLRRLTKALGVFSALRIHKNP